MNFDPSQHHRRSLRLREFDYSQAGAYFITICTIEKETILGEVLDEVMILTPSGKIVSELWKSIPRRFPTVELDYFFIMPNHFHGILVLHEGPTHQCRGLVSTPNSQFGKHGHDTCRPVLGEVIAYFKYLTTKEINLLTHTPGRKVWQRNYHEHVIRNEQDLELIREYVINNPLKWQLDCYYLK